MKREVGKRQARTFPNPCPKIAMAPKRKSSVQTEGSKKKRQGTREEDNFRSTAEALRAAPADKRIIRVDPTSPFSSNPGIQVNRTGVLSDRNLLSLGFSVLAQ